MKILLGLVIVTEKQNGNFLKHSGTPLFRIPSGKLSDPFPAFQYFHAESRVA
jgi:hypothetical protein